MLLNKITILKSGKVGNHQGGLAIFFGPGSIQIRNFFYRSPTHKGIVLIFIGSRSLIFDFKICSVSTLN